MDREEMRDRIDAIIEQLMVLREALGESAQPMQQEQSRQHLGQLSVYVHELEEPNKGAATMNDETAIGAAYHSVLVLRGVLNEIYPRWPTRLVNGMSEMARSINRNSVVWIEGWDTDAAVEFLHMAARQSQMYGDSLLVARFRGHSWSPRGVGAKGTAQVLESLSA